MTPELDAALDDTIDVVFTVLKFIRPKQDPNAAQYPKPPIPHGHRDTWAAVKASLERHELPPLWALRQVAGWACIELYWRTKGRALTPEEVRIGAAAYRLYAATRTLTH
jgi:hypothetical protein